MAFNPSHLFYSFETSQGSIYTYQPSGQTKREAPWKNKSYNPEGITTFANFDSDKAQSAFSDAIYAPNDNHRVYITNGEGDRVWHINDVKDPDKLHAVIADRNTGKVIHHTPVSLLPTRGAIPLEVSESIENGQRMTSRHMGHEVIKIRERDVKFHEYVEQVKASRTAKPLPRSPEGIAARRKALEAEYAGKEKDQGYHFRHSTIDEDEFPGGLPDIKDPIAAQRYAENKYRGGAWEKMTPERLQAVFDRVGWHPDGYEPSVKDSVPAARQITAEIPHEAEAAEEILRPTNLKSKVGRIVTRKVFTDRVKNMFGAGVIAASEYGLGKHGIEGGWVAAHAAQVSVGSLLMAPFDYLAVKKQRNMFHNIKNPNSEFRKMLREEVATHRSEWSEMKDEVNKHGGVGAARKAAKESKKSTKKAITASPAVKRVAKTMEDRHILGTAVSTHRSIVKYSAIASIGLGAIAYHEHAKEVAQTNAYSQANSAARSGARPRSNSSMGGIAYLQ